MNSATGTKSENLSEQDRNSRRRGMKLISDTQSRKAFRIGISDDLSEMLRSGENHQMATKKSSGPKVDDKKRPEDDPMGIDEANGSGFVGFVGIVTTMAAAALTGRLLGYLLRRRRD